MKKICFVGNYPSHYREPIFRLLDKEYDMEWHFLNQKSTIKGLDIGILKNAVKEDGYFFGSWYIQKNILKLAFRKDFVAFIVIGEPYCLSSWGIVRLLKLIRPSVKIYFWSHGWYGKEGKVKRVIKRHFFKPADEVFLYGSHAKSLMIKEGFDESRLIVVHNSLNYRDQIDIRKTLNHQFIFKDHFNNDLHNLIFIGRLTQVKRLDLLLHAMALLNKNGEKYNLTLVGDGEERQSLQKLSSALGLTDNIWFFGASYDEKQNAELIYNADLCVSPGNVGLTAMHTMVYGTPVLTHDDFAWQMPEFEAIIPGKTGDFFNRDSVTSLAERISNWFDFHKEDREDVRRSCYKVIDESWTPEYQLNVFKKIIG